jgi:hypothetical protein
MQGVRLGKSPPSFYDTRMRTLDRDLDDDGARVLSALLDGRGFTAREVAYRARVDRDSADQWLAEFEERGWLRGYAHGPHHYLALGDGVVVPDLEAGLAARGSVVPEPRRLRPQIASELRDGRTCYGHLAGVLGLAVTEALTDLGHLVLEDDAFALTEPGRAFLHDVLGVDIEVSRQDGPTFARRCLDRTQRRPHLGGSLGRALAARCFEAGWLKRTEGRGVRATATGQAAFAERLGLSLPESVLLQ